MNDIEEHEMARKKTLMNAIKRAVSPTTQLSTPSSSTQSPVSVSARPLTQFICSRLEGENLQLFALMFAEAIKNDRHARVTLFENVYKFLGYEQYGHAVRQLKKLFPGTESSQKNFSTEGEVSSSARGPSKDAYLISVRQFETMMHAAKTNEGATAREMMLDLKDAVQDYMKMEMEASARRAHEQLEEQTSRLAIKEARRLELETAQLQATFSVCLWYSDKKGIKKSELYRVSDDDWEIKHVGGNQESCFSPPTLSHQYRRCGSFIATRTLVSD